MLDEPHAAILIAVVLQHLRRRGADARVDDERAARDGPDSADHREEVCDIEVVEDAEGEDEIELAVTVGRKIADVAELEVDIQTERARGETRFLDVRLAAFDRDHLCAAARELERIHAFEAGEIEHAQPSKRSAEYVGGELRDVKLKQGESFRLTPGTVHQMIAVTDCDVLEASTAEVDDVVRISADRSSIQPARERPVPRTCTDARDAGNVRERPHRSTSAEEDGSSDECGSPAAAGAGGKPCGRVLGDGTR